MSTQHYQLSLRSEAFNSVMQETLLTNAHGEKSDLENGINQLIARCEQSRKQGSTIYLVGNGGSAAVASHAVTDFVNVARLRAFVLHESALITCMANDFGYDQAFKRIINTVFCKNDLLIAISSSGKSANICNAAKMAKSLGGTVVTLTGFNEENPLRKLGDINFWLNSTDYGFVEIGHLFLLHNIADRSAQLLQQHHDVSALAAFA